MKLRKMITLAAALLALPVYSAQASNIVGYNRIVIPAQSDVRLSIPFNLDVEATRTVATVSGTGVTVADALQAGEFNGTHYVRFISGNAEGLWFTIESNGTNNLVLKGFEQNLVAPGNEFRVYKHHTLGSVFPKGLLGSFFEVGTQILIYENNVDALTQNRAAVKTAEFTNANGGSWTGANVSNNTILEPETQFVLRNNANKSLEVMTLGDAPDYNVGVLVAPNGDVYTGSGFPAPVVLDASGLAGNMRFVMFYDNAATGKNKSASKIAAYTTTGGGRWVGKNVTGDELINPSDAITFRLPENEAGSKVTIKKPY